MSYRYVCRSPLGYSHHYLPTFLPSYLPTFLPSYLPAPIHTTTDRSHLLPSYLRSYYPPRGTHN